MAMKKPVYMLKDNELFSWEGGVWRKKNSKLHAGMAINTETGEEIKIPSMILVEPYVEPKTSFPVQASEEVPSLDVNVEPE